MQSPLRGRLARVLASAALAASLVLPATVRAAVGDPVVLRVGTVQDLDAMNPYLTEYFVGYEVFGLNYQLLVGFGLDSQPAPAFASSWTQAATTWTFKIDPGLKWSDGQPATSEDARWTLQTLLDQQNSDRGYAGAGYLDPYLTYAGVTSVKATDAQTLVIETETPNSQILTSYLPILPKHIWQDRDINSDLNKVPVVGTGAYQATEWKTDEYVRFVRNPNYTGPRGFEDEVYIQFFGDEAAMTEALKAGDIDYARNVTADQFDSLKSQPNVVTVESTVAAEANAFTQLNFNTYSKPIEGGGASTTALQDPLFRDALGYAIDKAALVDKILSGHGLVGSTILPPAMANGFWHLEPANPRTFDIAVAKQKLEAAGYKLDANGKLLDKENKPINLRMLVPDTSSTYAQSAEFITVWWKELGIDVTTQSLDADTVTARETPPDATPPGKADFDVVVWNWAGDVDPNSLLKILTTDDIGGNSDTFFSNARYDELFALQGAEPDQAKRKVYTDEMQQIVYDQAPYHILFYDAALHAYRTDRFSGWQLSPDPGGLPFFAYGVPGYDLLAAPAAAATASPSGGPSPSSSQAVVSTPAPSGSTDGSTTAGGSNVPLLLGGAALILVAVAILWAVSRRRASAAEEE